MEEYLKELHKDEMENKYCMCCRLFQIPIRGASGCVPGAHAAYTDRQTTTRIRVSNALSCLIVSPSYIAGSSTTVGRPWYCHYPVIAVILQILF